MKECIEVIRYEQTGDNAVLLFRTASHKEKKMRLGNERNTRKHYIKQNTHVLCSIHTAIGALHGIHLLLKFRLPISSRPQLLQTHY